MATIFVRVPEDAHIVICRGKSAAKADHEIIYIDDLLVFLEAHILRHLKSRFGPVGFEWNKRDDWRAFLQGETVRIIVFPEGKSYLQDGYRATIRRRDDPREMVILTPQVRA